MTILILIGAVFGLICCAGMAYFCGAVALAALVPDVKEITRNE